LSVRDKQQACAGPFGSGVKAISTTTTNIPADNSKESFKPSSSASVFTKAGATFMGKNYNVDDGTVVGVLLVHLFPILCLLGLLMANLFHKMERLVVMFHKFFQVPSFKLLVKLSVVDSSLSKQISTLMLVVIDVVACVCATLLSVSFSRREVLTSD
jgi:hypothetical protein